MRTNSYLFVYGTLRREAEHPMHQLLAFNFQFIGEATCRGKLYDLGAFPGAVPSEDPADRITGELYALHRPDWILPILDDYEGCGGDVPLYRREKWTTRLKDGTQIEAWVYVYARPVNNQSIVSSGDYLEYQRVSE